MILPRIQDTSSTSRLSVSLGILLSLAPLASAVNAIDCKDIVVKDHPYDLRELKGVHQVHWIRDEGEKTLNTTFHISLCSPLGKDKLTPDRETACPAESNICAYEHWVDHDSGDTGKRTIPIAGNYNLNYKRPLDAKWSQLKDSGSSADADKEGIRVEMHGGRYPWKPNKEKKHQLQMAYIEFMCNPKRDGLGGDEPDDEFESGTDDAERLRRREDEKKEKDGEKDKDEDKGKHDDSNPNKDLRFISYDTKDEKEAILRLEWTTKHACRDDKGGKAEGASWGFFTWLIIILFLGIATYLIFGSWLNYNRYGARGWDLLPHGDTIRDIPYYAKDFGRRVVGVFQSPAQRGGYSAV